MEEIERKKENKMGTTPVPKLLITMSLPIMISMLVQALYNVVDSIFVARYSADAMTAVSLAFPVQNFMIALGVGTGVGINALLSRNLGEKKYEEANKAAGNGLFLALCNYIVLALFGIFGTRAFFQAQTNNLAIIESGVQYLTIISTMSFGLFFTLTLEKLLQATGNTFYSMLTQGAGAIVNIILDPIFIFGLFGVPEMGVAGAAIATVIGQIVSMFLGILYNAKRNHEIKIKVRGFRPERSVIWGIYVVGIPSIIMQSIGSVMVYGFNKILLLFSEVAVSVFGIYFKLNSFIFMPVFGLNSGMIPIIAYNYGAKNKKRIMDTVKLSLFISGGIMAAGFLLFQFASPMLLGMFKATPEMLQIGVPALKIISISFVFAGFCINLSSVFQSFGNGILSLVVSVARQLFVILPAAYILAMKFGISAIWWSIPLAEIVSVFLSIVFFKYLYEKKIHHMEESI
ncbi:MAG: MATE family efflux transporter [Acetivibrio sp.]